MPDSGYMFDDGAVRRIARSVRWTENHYTQSVNPTDDIRPIMPVFRVVNVTSTTLQSGMYPAKIQFYDPNVATWADGETCFAVGLNGETLALKRYVGMLVGIYMSTGQSVFAVTTGGGCTGESVTISYIKGDGSCGVGTITFTGGCETAHT